MGISKKMLFVNDSRGREEGVGGYDPTSECDFKGERSKRAGNAVLYFCSMKSLHGRFRLKFHDFSTLLWHFPV